LTAVTEESDKPATLPRLEFGPAMRSLRPQQQRAILSLFQTEGNRTQAMKLAGYGKTSHKSVKSHASAFFRNERVRAAVREVAEHEIAVCEPELLALTWSIARDAGVAPRDRLRALSMVWDRANPVLNKHEIKVGVHLSADQIDTQHYRALKQLNAPEKAFLDRFGVNGLPRVRALVEAEELKQKRQDAVDGVIEGEYEETTND
jgi:phage terminase small subunit